MADSRTYRLGAVTVEQLGRHVEQHLRGKADLYVEAVAGPGGFLVQARLNGQDWRKFIGLDQAVQVQLVPGDADSVQVTVGQGKWLDKLGAGAVGALWFPPLAIVSGIGALSQVKLVNDIYSEIQNFLIRGGA
ncbi:MAG: hypothetical protein LBS56_06475 [Propionibacteriaceae bacterium]|jgi:hypothetical protein|nr:hypothetical protein [Propionibacteriaceae bacterium]